MEKVEVMLEEYRSLRTEINQAMNNRNQIVAFGLATMGALVLAGSEVLASPLSFWIFAVLVPVVGFLVLWMWFSEFERVSRASHYLSALENEINELMAGEKLLKWEAWLRSGTKHLWSDAYTGITLFILFGTSPLAYAMFGFEAIDLRTRLVTGSVMFTVVAFLFVLLVFRIQRWQEQLSTTICIRQDMGMEPLSKTKEKDVESSN